MCIYQLNAGTQGYTNNASQSGQIRSQSQNFAIEVWDKTNKSMLGLVASPGWPRTVYKSNIEYRFLNVFFLDEMTKWILRSRSMTTVFNPSQENLSMHNWCKFGDCSSNPLLMSRQAKFPRILSQNGQDDIEGQSQLLLFSIPADNIPLCSQKKWTDWRSDADNDDTPLAWKARG